MKEIITIAIPVYNAMPYLRDAIQSVVNQTYKDWILYLINDGSTDESLSLMYKFAKQDNRIKVINDDLNKGLIYRLNESIEFTNTKYYARMDADDIMYITRIEEQIKFLESHPEVDVLGSSIMTIDSKNHIIGSGRYQGRVKEFIHPTIMGKTLWFKNNPYCNWAHRAEDTELWIRTSSNSIFVSLDKPLLFYREFGMPTLKKTLQSLYTVCRISTRYRQYQKSFFWFINIYVKSIMKMIIYCFFDFIGKIDYIVSLRNRPPLPKDKILTDSDLLLCINTCYNENPTNNHPL